MDNRKFITQGEGLPNWYNNMCFVCGQLSVNEEGQYVPGTMDEQARLAFSHVFSVLKASGFDKNEIVYIDIAFSDLSEVDVVNQLYMTFFEENRRPARTIYQAAQLPFGG